MTGTSSLRDQLQEIYDRHGQLTPALVVDEARDETHPLHHRFEWNDSRAAEAWRREQAHGLIQSVRIVYREHDGASGDKTVRAFHAIRGPDGHRYEPAEKVAADPLLARMVAADMEREWRALRRRYDEFEEFWQLIRTDLEQAA